MPILHAKYVHMFAERTYSGWQCNGNLWKMLRYLQKAQANHARKAWDRMLQTEMP